MTLVELAVDVEWPDQQAAEQFAAAHAHRPGTRLHEIGSWFAAVQSTSTPHPPRRIGVVRFGFPADAPPPLTIAGVVADVRDVASAPDTAAAVVGGVAAADDEVDRGADLVVLAVARRGVVPEILASALTGTEPVKVLPRGAVLSPDVWMQRAVDVRDGRRRVAGLRGDPDALLAALGDPDLAAACAFVLRAAARRTPMLIDGVGACAAALTAHHVQSRTARWWLVADRSADTAALSALEALGRPLLDVGIAGGDGTAGLLAAAVIGVAVESAIRPGTPGDV